ncbi:hypothetical protein C8F01DRAFT_1148924 [Mycena amicta]|nr:hypothetical protein C8F01DRAFT_1148924 [Mycena amicta]
MPALPVEVVEIILSFLLPHPLELCNNNKNLLDKPTARTVANCGLVCRAWLTPSRRVLFYRTQITLAKAHRFEQLVLPSNRAAKGKNASLSNLKALSILPFIRELELVTGLAENRWMHTVFEPRISAFLTERVYSLVLHARGWADKDKTIPLPPTKGFTRLTRLELRGAWNVKLADVLQCIAAFPVLRELVVAPEQALQVHGTDDVGVLCVPPATLKKAAFIYMPSQPVFDWISRSGVSQQLEDLQFTFPERILSLSLQYACASLEFIARQGPALRTLGVHFSSKADYFAPHEPAWGNIDPVSQRLHDTALGTRFLQSNTRLETLHLLGPSHLICDFLRLALASQTSLHTLIFTPPPLWLRECTQLDELFSSENARALQCIVLERVWTLDIVRVKDSLPLSVARGVLEVRVHEHGALLF